MLGSALVRFAEAHRYEFVATNRSQLNIQDVDMVAEYYAREPDIDIVINAAGVVRHSIHADGRAMTYTNTVGPHVLSTIFTKVVQISTDCVFDGLDGPYNEGSPPCPADAYGVSKLGGELHRTPDLTIRGSFIGFGKGSFLDRMIFNQPKEWNIQGFNNWYWSGFYVDTFAALVFQMANTEGLSGLIHAAGPPITKHGLLKAVSTALRPDLGIQHLQHNEPKNMVLESIRMSNQSRIVGLDYTATLPNMIERMRLDYSNLCDNTSRPTPGE